MKNNITRLEKRSTRQVFYANETNFFKVQYNNVASTNGDKVSLNTGGRMNFMINFNEFHKYTSIKKITLKVKVTTSASVEFNDESSLSSNNQITNGNYASDSNGYIVIDLINECYPTQMSVNYFSIVTKGSYTMYKETTTINDYKPQIIVEYIDDCESLINQKVIEGSAGRALSYSVNVRTGKVECLKSLLNIPTTVLPINLGLYFDPLVEYLNDNYMPGRWKFNYNQKIILNDEGYEYIDGMGGHHQFKVSYNESNVYFDIAGTGLILTKEGTSYKIEDGYDNKLVFNSSGYLYRVINTINGNEYGIEIEYENLDYIKYISEYIKEANSTSATVNRKITITYSTDTVSISSTGFPTITLNKFWGCLESIIEEDERKSTYTYDIKGMIASAASDNGEKVIFTYDDRTRIKTVTECVTSEENTLSKLTFNYKYLATHITNNFGVKLAYNFDGEGELIAQYEKNDGNIYGMEYVRKTDNVEEKVKLSDEAFIGYENVSLYGNSSVTKDVLDSLSRGSREIKSDSFYALMFTYNYTGNATTNTSSYIIVLQDNIELARFKLSCLCGDEEIGGVTFKVNSESPLQVKVEHGYSSAILNVGNIRISQSNLVRVESMANWTMGEIPYEYIIDDITWKPILTKGYIIGNESFEKRVTLDDILETQKNAARNPSSYNVWYNNKRGLIVNVNNVKVCGENNGAYDILLQCYGVVNNSNYALSIEYTDYDTDIDLEDYICTVYNKVSINGNHRKVKETNVNKHLQPIITFNYTNNDNVLVTEYSFDKYGNLILEKCINKTNNLQTEKEYQYNKKILIKEIVKEGGNTLTTTYQTNENTGNIEKVTLPNGGVINYTYLANTDGKLSEISSTVNGVKNTNVFDYSKDKISGYNTNRYGYYMSYDKYNMLSQLTNASHLIWATSRVVNTNTIVETTYLGIGYYYIENTYDKYGNLILTKEGKTNDTLEVVKEVYYSDLDVNSITTNNPQDASLKKNKYSKLRKTIDKLLMNTTKYYYDNKDRIKNIVNSSTTYKPGLTEYEYDEYNRLTTKKVNLNSGVIFTENVEYGSEDDAYKNILSSRINYSDGSENKTFEVLLNEEKDSLGRIDYHSFEINDRTEIKRNFVYKDVGSNVSGLVQRLDLDINNLAVDKLYYEYDIMGNITHEYSLSNVMDNKYTYDTLGRLIREDNKALGKSTVITYDLGGNILKKEVSSYTLGALPTTATKYTYEYQQYHADYLNKYNGQTVQTASCGNIEKIGNTTYSWDRYRFLKQAKLSSYDYVDMLYDVDGIRYKKTHYDNGTTITHNYVCEGTKILSENIIGGSYAGTLNYLYIGNQIIGFTYKNKQYYYQKNLQGDIIRIYDTSNNLVAYYQYDAWGNHRVYNPTGTINTSDSFIGNINPFRYRGYYYDRESNLYYCNARYYNPELCRWMSLDSIDYAEADRLNGCNLYVYCGNNPVNCCCSSIEHDSNKSHQMVKSKNNNLFNALYVLSTSFSNFDTIYGFVSGGIDGSLKFLVPNGIKSLELFSKFFDVVGVGMIAANSVLSFASSVYTNFNNSNYTLLESIYASRMDFRYYTIKGILTYKAGAIVSNLALTAGTSVGVAVLGATIGGLTISFTGAFIIGSLAAIGVGLLCAGAIYLISEGADAFYEYIKEEMFE